MWGKLWATEDAINDAVIDAPLTHSLYSTKGPDPIYVLSSTGSAPLFVKNHLGYMEESVAGECPFYGARRVRNLARSSNNFGNATHWRLSGSSAITAVNDSTVTGPNSTLDQQVWMLTRAAATANSLIRLEDSFSYVGRGLPVAMSVWAKAGTLSTIELRIWDSAAIGTYVATQVITLTSSWQRIAVVGTPVAGTTYRLSMAAGDLSSGATGTVYISNFQLEEIIGDSNTAPSEYVSRDDMPRGMYWHGAAVDGVQYFNTAKGNTLAGTGVVTEATGAALTTAVGVACCPSAFQFVTNTDTLAGSTQTNCTIPSSLIAAPSGVVEGLRVLESTDAGAVAHYVQHTLSGGDTYDDKYICSSIYVKAGTITWGRFVLSDLDAGTSKSVYFNLSTGAVGTSTSGVMEVETLANGWFRFMWTVKLTTGASVPAIRFYIVSADNTATYQGNGTKYCTIWKWNITSALTAASTSDKPIAPLAVSNTSGSGNNIPGRYVSFMLKGLLGKTNFGVVSTFTPYFTATRVDKGQYSAVTYIRTDSLAQVCNGFNIRDFDRTGLTIRPNASPGSVHLSKWAFDFYNGELNPLIRWDTLKARGTAVAVGEWVIPNAATPDNSGAHKAFRCQVAGTLGNTEPTWDTTYVATPDTTTNITSENAPGTAKWQVNDANGITGNWEPYRGCHLAPLTSTFGATTKYAWFIADDDYGCYENGTAFVKQTSAVNAMLGNGCTLRHNPTVLYLGTTGSKVAAGTTFNPIYTVDNAMPPYVSFHKNLKVIKRRLNAAFVAGLSIL